MVELTDPEWECPRCPDGFIIPGRGCDSCGMSLVEVGSLTKDLPRASAEYRLVVSTENPSRPSPIIMHATVRGRGSDREAD